MSITLRPKSELVNSAAPWAGLVPLQWGAASLRWKSRIFAGGTPDKAKIEFWENGTVPWLNSGSVNQYIITSPSTFITEEAVVKSSTRWVPRGSIVVALAGQGKTKGMAARLAINSTCNQSMAAVIPSHDLNVVYLHYFLQDNYQNIRNLAGGDLRDGLNLEMLASIVVPLPALLEQRQIAAYLNRETAKIDKLIVKQQKLIKLLAEKRRAVISQAVTKGLDLNAKMKDSGVEWLGEVPETWLVTSIKHISDVRDGTHDTPSYVDPSEESRPLVTSKDISSGVLDIVNTKHISFEDFTQISKRSGVATGDVLMPMIGTVGGAFIVGAEQDFAIKNIALFKHSSRALSKWIAYSLDSNATLYQFDLQRSGGVQSFVSLGTLRNLIICVPPLDEQSEVLAKLSQITLKLDTLIIRSETSLSLLKEHRQALITAAVTGKIDVRDLVTDEEVAALDAEHETPEIDENLDDEADEVSYTEGDEEEAL